MATWDGLYQVIPAAHSGAWPDSDSWVCDQMAPSSMPAMRIVRAQGQATNPEKAKECKVPE